MSVFSGIQIAEEVLPLALQIFQKAIEAADVVAQDTGKPWNEVAQDVINHLDKDAPNSPSLTPGA